MEYGRGVEFDVYYAKDFLELIKEIKEGDRRYSMSIHNMNVVDMTCAICLDSFVVREDKNDGK